MTTLFGIPIETLTMILVVAFAAAMGAVLVLAARNRVFFRLGVRNIGRRRGRTVLIVLGLMLGTAIIAAALNTGDTISHTIRTTAVEALGEIDETVSVASAVDDAVAGDVPISSEYFDEDVFEEVEEAALRSGNVDGVAPAIMEPVAVQDVDSRQNEPRVSLFASDPERMDGFGTIERIGGGTASLGELGADEVFLNADAAEELDAQPGHELLMYAGGRETPLRVADIVEYRGTGGTESSLLMPLAAAQQAFGKDGQIRHIIISNEGDEISGAAHSDNVIDALEPTVEELGLEATPVKQDVLDAADEFGAVFMSFFGTFGTFSIAAGILLIFLIFVMLSAERKTEMGIARAVGTQRENLIQMFLFEGTAYDLAAAAVGTLLGVAVAYGMVFVMSQAMGAFGLDIQHDLRLSSLIIAYTLGVLLTLAVVTVSAWRVSVLNVVTAIRNLPEPAPRRRRRSLAALGAGGIVLGVLLAYSGVQIEQSTPFGLGISLVIIGFVPLLRGLGAPDRVAYSGAGIALVIWWLLPFDATEALVGEMGADFSIFIIAGLLVVVGSVWTVIYNSDLILRGVMAVFGRVRWIAPVLKTAVSYPLSSRFRTGVTLAMFTLVVFTLVCMSAITTAFNDAFNDEESFGGGFDLRGSTVPINPVEDMEQALGTAPGIVPSDFEVVANQSLVALDMRQTGGPEERDFEPYIVHGMDDSFIENTTYEFAMLARGYDSPEAVWQALGNDPTLAIIDSYPVPRRANFNFGDVTDFKLEGLYLEDETFDPVRLELRDPQTGNVQELTVIGVLKETIPDYMVGVAASQETMESFMGDRAPLDIHFFSLRDGVDEGETADALESAFLQNGMEAEVVSELLEDAVSTSLTFNYLLQGFMGLGLVIGVAALGVISARAVVERRQQIGVLRSIGFQPEMVQLSFLVESSFISLLGIALGTFLGLAMAFLVIRDSSQQPSWENISFTVPWFNLLIIFAIVYAASLITTLIPARQASRVYPAEALRYQ